MRELERENPADPAPRPRLRGPLAIVGTGRAGGALAAAAERAGFEVRLAGRDGAAEAVAGAQAALLCVPDEAIAEGAQAVAHAHPHPELVGHVSGAARLEVLAPARGRGAALFSLHPLQTIPDPGAELAGAPCAIAADGPVALEFARDLAVALEMRPFAVPEDHRATYHAAASIASNFLVALEESAAELLAEAGIDDARELLAPLVARTTANWVERGAEALTGPIARGDEATVARHLEALAEHRPDLLSLYETLAERTRAIAGARSPAGVRG